LGEKQEKVFLRKAGSLGNGRDLLWSRRD